jgi:hypothetical protein
VLVSWAFWLNCAAENAGRLPQAVRTRMRITANAAYEIVFFFIIVSP